MPPFNMNIAQSSRTRHQKAMSHSHSPSFKRMAFSYYLRVRLCEFYRGRNERVISENNKYSGTSFGRLPHRQSPHTAKLVTMSHYCLSFLPPADEVCEGYVFTGVCHSVHRGGRVWLLRRGPCVVAPGEGGLAWLLQGGVCGCSQGERAWLLPGEACVVAPRGGVRGCSGGACMVAPGGCAWLLLGGCAWLLLGGGVCGCSRGGHAWLLRGGACVVALGGACMVARGGRGHAWFFR